VSSIRESFLTPLEVSTNNTSTFWRNAASVARDRRAQADMRLIDGAHRLRAARQSASARLSVTYFDGTAEEAFALSIHLT